MMDQMDIGANHSRSRYYKMDDDGVEDGDNGAYEDGEDDAQV
jgi:hypothetical protein